VEVRKRLAQASVARRVLDREVERVVRRQVVRLGVTRLHGQAVLAPREERGDGVPEELLGRAQLAVSQVPELREIRPSHLVACFHPGA
jgi:hypothetical protein